MTLDTHYIMKMNIEMVYDPEEDFDESTLTEEKDETWMTVNCDFKTKKNYQMYEGDSFDDIDHLVEHLLPVGFRFECTDGGPEPVCKVKFSELTNDEKSQLVIIEKTVI
jgi:uncharacterized protein YfdQ (DUF2303 family)